MKSSKNKYRKIALCIVLAVVLVGLSYLIIHLSNIRTASGYTKDTITSAQQASTSAQQASGSTQQASPEATAQSTESAQTGETTPPPTDANKVTVLTSYSSAGANSIIIKWEAVPDAKGYEIYRSNIKGGEYGLINTITDTSYTDTGLKMGNKYSYKIRACFNNGNDNSYGPFTGEFEIEPIPSMPKMFRADFSKGSILLKWSAVEGASAYEVYRCDTPDGKFLFLNRVTGTTYKDRIVGSKAKYYTIRACGKAEDGSLVKGKESQEEYAVKGDITDKCTFVSSANRETFDDAVDNNYKTSWDSGKTPDDHIDISAGQNKAGGIYVVWDAPPESWELYGIKDGGTPELITQGGKEGYLTQFIYIPSAFSGYGQYRLALKAASDADPTLTEISVFSPGNVPYYAPRWQPFAGRADILTVVAHPDDEDLYMGAPAPFYTNEGKRCVTAYMSYCTKNRRYEAQESAWTLGNRNYPAMRYAQDTKTYNKEDAMKYWPLDESISYIVEQIRKFKPSVIVTHDINGEYGHGAHMLTEYAVEQAFNASGDPSKYPDSANKYGTWKAGKLYVHLCSLDPLNPIDVEKPLSAFGGKSSYKVTSQAYARQKSQLGRRAIPEKGEYDMRIYGLKLTNLGEDITHTSMFENVTDEVMLSLNPWYGAAATDRSSLKEAINEAKSKKEADYTAVSWQKAGLEKLITDAQAVLGDNSAPQYKVEAKAAELYKFIGMLIPA